MCEKKWETCDEINFVLTISTEQLDRIFSKDDIQTQKSYIDNPNYILASGVTTSGDAGSLL
jgi:hypothetical protein